jgi:hypothetical protein
VPELRPITATCRPRQDVLSGGLADNHFAAQLDQVVRNPSGYPVYGDPTEFFALTYPTEGLKRLLTSTFGRLVGAKVPGAEHGVIRCETSFGGGKTHSLMAIYHLARGARPLGLEEFLDPQLLPSDCQVAAVVADTLDPENGLETNGVRTYTIWGEIGAQLGPSACEELLRSDERRTAPSKTTLEEVIGDRPTVIIIDEIAQYLRQLSSSGNPDTRRLGEALPAFLKNLFEVGAGKTNVVVIVTLATRQDAYGRETDDLSDLMDQMSEYASNLSDTQSVLARTASIVKPADDYEIAQILKRRLFASIDAQAAESAGSAYRDYYQDLARRGENLAGGADAPVTYGEAVATSYPFHPELVRVLDKRIGSIPAFQRARGALRLLAEVIAAIWAEQRDTEIINVADIDYSRPDVLNHLTYGIGRPDFNQVARADFAGSDAHAHAVDATRFAGRRPYATRASTTVFTHSLELLATAGAGRNDYLLGTLCLGDEPAVIGEALAEVERVAWHLVYDGLRWRFQVEPNVNAIIAEETKNIPNSRVSEELEELIRRTFPTAGAVKSIVFPTGTGDVPDRSDLRLVAFHYDDVSVSGSTSSPPPSRVVDFLDHAGIGGGIRTFRNSLIFLVADKDAYETMRERVRASIAVNALTSDSSRIQSFSPDVQKRLRGAADSARLEARIAVARCYKHLYVPWQDKANGYLKHIELSPKAQGEADKPQTQVILQVLVDEGKVRSAKIATDYLQQRAWPKGAGEVTTQAVSEAFWRDHGAQIVLDPTILRETIRDGVRNGSWVYYDAPAERVWTLNDAPAPVNISAETYLYTVDTATEKGILHKQLTWSDVQATILADRLPAADLRRQLESALGWEPTKSEIAEVLARAADGGPNARIVVVTGAVEPGMKACGPAQLKAAAFDSLTVLTIDEAKRLSILVDKEKGVTSVETPPQPAGVAFQALAEKALETPSPGFTSLSITAAAELGEGPRDLSLLGKALGQLPKFDIQVTVRMQLDFKGLKPGIEFELSGPGGDYQRVEDELLALAKTAERLAGTLRLDVRFGTPCRGDSPDYAAIRKVVTGLQPGALRLKGALAQ